jgi:hypothetical protein
MGTTSDKGVLTRKLGAADYDPVRYVAEISQRCVGMSLYNTPYRLLPITFVLEQFSLSLL